MINGISQGYNPYGVSSYNAGSGLGNASAASAQEQQSPYTVHNALEAKRAGLSEAQIRGMKRSGQIKCAACSSRKYQDGSDEQVSFKSATHISPNAAGAAVRAHEGEHVSNAYKKAAMNNGKVIHAGVSIHTAICPECGRSFVSGGVTHTTIKYNLDNPYGRNAKSLDAANGLPGMSINVRR